MYKFCLNINRNIISMKKFFDFQKFSETFLSCNPCYYSMELTSKEIMELTSKEIMKDRFKRIDIFTKISRSISKSPENKVMTMNTNLTSLTTYR